MVGDGGVCGGLGEVARDLGSVTRGGGRFPAEGPVQKRPLAEGGR